MAGIGSPLELVEKVKAGVYEPHVTSGAKRSAAIRINLDMQATQRVNLIDDEDHLDDELYVSKN